MYDARDGRFARPLVLILPLVLLLAGPGPFASAAHAQSSQSSQQATQKPPQPSAKKPAPPPQRPPQMDPAAKSDVSYGPASVAKAAREALQAGKADEAIGIAERVLVRDAAFAPAAAVKIDALFALEKPADAIAAYDDFLKASGRDDAALLSTVARGVLRQIASQPNDLAAPGALEALARAGETSARATLIKNTSPDAANGSSAMLSTEALARLGDEKALDTLIASAAGESSNSSASALKALGELRERRAKPVVLKALDSRNIVVRLAAITAAGRLGLIEAKPVLSKALADRPFILALQAAVALGQLGDNAGQSVLNQALTSEYADARLAGAQGMAAIATARTGGRPGAAAATSTPTWVANLRSVLENRDALFRFQAAELLLPYDRAAAVDVLTKGATDPNPVIRNEVSRIVSADPQATPASIRPFLKDTSAFARLYAARRLSQAPDTNAQQQKSQPKPQPRQQQ